MGQVACGQGRRGSGPLMVGLFAATALATGCLMDEDGLAVPDPTPPPATDPARDPEPMTPPAAACTPGQVHCSGKVPQNCGADGAWVTGPACAYACQDGCVNRFAAVSSGHGSPTNADGVAEFARNSETFYSQRGGLLGARGFNVAVMDPATGQAMEPVRNFDPWVTPLTDNALGELADYLEALEPGRLLMIAVCDDAGLTQLNSCTRRHVPEVARVVQALERLGSREIGSYCFRGAWSFVTMTGQRGALAEKSSRGSKVTAEVMLPAEP